MNYVTMVARHGDVKKDNVYLNYTLIGSDLSVKTLTGKELAAAISSGRLVVTNMGVTSDGLVSTNGSIKNYTTFDLAGNLVGKPRCVILGRIEKEDKLVGYTMFNTNGTVGNVNVAVAADLASKNMIANGKIRHCADGDIVSSINGTYPLMQIKTAENTKAKLNMNVIFFGCINGGTEYAGITFNSDDALFATKVFEYMKLANEKFVEKIENTKQIPANKIGNFKIKQAPGVGFSGVFTLETVKSLMTKANKIEYPESSLIVGCVDSKDPENESIVIYDTKTKSIVKSQPGTGESDIGLNKYLSKVRTIVSGIK